MAIAEGSGARFVVKPYASGVMVSDTLDNAPGATGGQVMRRVSSTLNLKVNATRSQEINASRQVKSARHTSKRVEGSITGELSPTTYFDLLSAAHRDTPAAGVTLIPATGHVRRKFAIERYNADLDIARLYTECRVTGYKISVPAEGISTIELMFMGRARQTLSGASAPYFTGPAAATNTNVVNSLDGSLSVNGTRVGLVTAFDVAVNLSADAPTVLGQAFPPDILLGTADVTGNLTVLLDDTDAMAAAFEAESEIAISVVLSDGGDTPNTITIDLPRVKLMSGDEQVQGEASQLMQMSFQALEADTGDILSTIQITDSSLSGV